MPQAILFYFTGTGNSLFIARQIAATMEEACEIRLMEETESYKVPAEVKKIGFVYPTYFVGAPAAVEDFVKRMDLSENKDAYYFAITTCGLLAGNAVSSILSILRKKGASRLYGQKLKMASNYIVLYDFKKQTEKQMQAEKNKLNSILKDLKQQKTLPFLFPHPLWQQYHRFHKKRVPLLDENFLVSSACISCRICEAVCPANNIIMQEGKPTFLHKCQQCVACIQFCPQEAINYGHRTQTRTHYRHPKITWKDLKNGKVQGKI